MELNAAIRFLVIFLAVTYSQTQAEANWQKANSDPVCFSARDNLYGSFGAPSHGNVASIKLVHLYGYVTCDVRNPLHWSFWGCGHMMEDVNVVITDSNNVWFLPRVEFLTNDVELWFRVPGYNSFSKEIVLSSFDPFQVQVEGEYRLWYGEDLTFHSEHDNGGRVCADVYMLYV